MRIFNKKVVAFLIVLTFSFFVFHGTDVLYADSVAGNNSIKNVKKSGIIEQQAEWDRPVKKKKSILPFIIGGVIIAGGIIAAVLLLKKKEDPRGVWNVQMKHASYNIPQFNFTMKGSDRNSGTWTIAKFTDRGTWKLTDGNHISIRANFGSDFSLTGTIEDDHMTGNFVWGQFKITDGTWIADRVSGSDNVEVNSGSESLSKAVK
jgi:hypothetical protein